MTQAIIIGWPPNIEEIAVAFPIVRRMGTNRDLAFSYGDAIYTPTRWKHMPGHILEHEQVHGRQQLAMGVESWWTRYLIDKQFRLEQELMANRVQWQAIIDSGAPRFERRKLLSFMAGLIAGPLYGHMITKEQAKREIRGGGDE